MKKLYTKPTLVNRGAIASVTGVVAVVMSPIDKGAT